MAVVAQVGFQDDDDAEEVEVDKTPKRKVHGRKPTAFVPNKANADARCQVPVSTFALSLLTSSRSLHPGVWPFRIAQVNFDDDAEDIEVEEEDRATLSVSMLSF